MPRLASPPIAATSQEPAWSSSTAGSTTWAARHARIHGRVQPPDPGVTSRRPTSRGLAPADGARPRSTRRRAHPRLLGACRGALPRPTACRPASWTTSATPCGRSAGSTAGPRRASSARSASGPSARAMIDSGLCRTTINAAGQPDPPDVQVGRRRGAGPAAVVQGLQAVAACSRGRTEARETEPVRPVPVEHVEAVLPFLPGRSPRWSDCSC